VTSKGSKPGERSAKRISARQPQRKPGQLRFQKLLQALDELLRDHNVQDVGLYQIAKKAGVPNASIYHFFPSKEAALLALAEVHHQALHRISLEAPARRPASWQQLSREKVALAADYHNRNPAALRLFLGTNVSLEVKSADVSQYRLLAQTRAAMLDRYFQVPSVPEWHRRLATYMAIIDGVFSLSYSQHGRILPSYIDEAQLAGIAYLRCYLPEVLFPREAVTTGEVE